MRIFEYIRRVIFWCLDFIKGGPVRKHLKEVSSFLEHPLSKKAIRINNENLRKLLEHATSNVKFYQKYKATQKISDFPVVNKGTIKSKMDYFLASDNGKRKLFPVTTSGSTGTPFKIYQDKRKKNRNTADTIYFARLAGYNVGYRLFYLKIWVEQKMQRKFEYWLQNLVPVDVIHLNNREIEYLVKKIERDRSTIGILGYSSALELMCKYLERRSSSPLRSRVRSIIAMSETLNDYTKYTLENYFGVPVVSRYSNLENGILAQQERNRSAHFLINTASYFIEILKMESNDPAVDGELGRIVVTDLFNYAMPMIRYDTGDIGAVLAEHNNEGRKYLSKVEGRKLDVLYDTKGELISSYIVYKNMWQYTEIDQYQLIQEGEKKYTFKINAAYSFNREAQLIDEFKSFLGKDAEFKIEYVSEIPLLSSGKRKKIVNNYITY